MRTEFEIWSIHSAKYRTQKMHQWRAGTIEPWSKFLFGAVLCSIQSFRFYLDICIERFSPVGRPVYSHGRSPWSLWKLKFCATFGSNLKCECSWREISRVVNAAITPGKMELRSKFIIVADLLLKHHFHFAFKNSDENKSARIMHSDLHHLALNLIPNTIWQNGSWTL